jgi:hypothetical protein
VICRDLKFVLKREFRFFLRIGKTAADNLLCCFVVGLVIDDAELGAVEGDSDAVVEAFSVSDDREQESAADERDSEAENRGEDAVFTEQHGAERTKEGFCLFSAGGVFAGAAPLCLCRFGDIAPQPDRSEQNAAEEPPDSAAAVQQIAGKVQDPPADCREKAGKQCQNAAAAAAEP